MSWWSTNADHWKRTGVILAAVGLLVTLVLFAIGRPDGSDPSTAPTVSNSSSSTGSPTRETSPSAEPSPSSTSPSPPNPPPPASPTSASTTPAVPPATGSYIWVNLTERPLVAQRLVFSDERVSIDGDNYSHSLKFANFKGGPGYAEFTLGRTCKAFAAVVGFDDDNSDSESTADFEVSLDNNVVWSSTASLGHPQTLVLTNLGNALRIRMESDFADDVGTPAYGRPRALCHR